MLDAYRQEVHRLSDTQASSSSHVRQSCEEGDTCVCWTHTGRRYTGFPTHMHPPPRMCASHVRRGILVCAGLIGRRYTGFPSTVGYSFVCCHSGASRPGDHAAAHVGVLFARPALRYARLRGRLVFPGLRSQRFVSGRPSCSSSFNRCTCRPPSGRGTARRAGASAWGSP